MRLVENSYYEHEQHGLIKVVSIDNDVVSFQKQNENVYTGGMNIPAGKKQEASDFLDEVEPADVNASADAAVFDLTGVNQ